MMIIIGDVPLLCKAYEFLGCSEEPALKCIDLHEKRSL